MTVEKKTQLEELLTACEGLGADLRYHPEQGHFTALVWEGWNLLMMRSGPGLSRRKFRRCQLSTQTSCAIALIHTAHWFIWSEKYMMKGMQHGIAVLCPFFAK